MPFPTTPYTKKGKFVVALLRIIYRILAVFYGKKWAIPLKNFEENPLYYTFKEILYFGYKYYYKPPSQFSKKHIQYFRNQDLDFRPDAEFISENIVTISAGGDLMPYEWIQPDSCKHLWDEVGSFFFGSDIVFANLETPINPFQSASFVPEVMLKDMMFNGSQELFSIFNGNGQFKGFDVLSTANNHSLDMGEEGLLETIEFLEKYKIKHTGTARNEQEQENPPLIEKNNIKIAFLAYTFSLNNFENSKDKPFLVNHLRLNKKEVELEKIKNQVVSAYQNGADFIVLSLHTGNAYQAFPSEHTVEIYHRIFEECGIDVILGSHPHNPQPMEKYEFNCPILKKHKKGFAIYSLSDFVAYDIFLWDRLVPLLKLTVQKGILKGIPHTQLTDVELLPVYNWGNMDKNNKKQMRFLPLKKVVDELKNGVQRPYFSKQNLLEIKELNRFCDECFLPENWKSSFKVLNG
jgi:hypothetical protein